MSKTIRTNPGVPRLSTRGALILAGALLGAAAFFLIFTGASLDVTEDSWILSGYVEKDIIQHYTGWLFYRKSPISFPLGIASGINWPQGCAVTYTDSIPLFAILFRLAQPLLPETFQYFGWFTLACYVLQGAFAAALLTLFTEKAGAVLPGTALFCCWPILVERSFRHTALAAQFLIVAGLYLYFKNRREGFRFRAGWLALLGLATTIHLYFLPMLFGLLFADLVQHMVETRSVKKPLLFLAAGFAVVLGTAYCIGVFSIRADAGASDYGFFALNLNSLYNPLSCGGILWSRLLGPRAQGLGSYDGFNYLGLGVLAALPVCGVLYAAKAKPHGLAALAKRHAALLFVCACLTVFAVSPTVLLGDRVLVSISLPDALQKLCSMFRSSGRMFYPISYLLLLFCIVTLSRLPGRLWPAAALAALLCVQVWDLSPAFAEKRISFTRPQAGHAVYELEDPLKDPLWEAVGGQYDTLFSLGDSLVGNVFLARYAVQNDMVTNIEWAARNDSAYRMAQVQAETERLARGEMDENTLYITSDLDTYLALEPVLAASARCLFVDERWYLFLPEKPGLSLPECETRYSGLALPFSIVDYSDDNWTGGVLNTDPAVCALEDNLSTQLLLSDAEYLIDEDGTEYRILKKDYRDAGWVMLTLDTDCTALRGKKLTAR